MALEATALQVSPNALPILTSVAIVFVVSVLVGGFGNYTGIRLVSDQHPSYIHAVISSILSAAVWAVVSYGLNVYDLGITPFAGALIALIVWIVVLYFRYEGGIVTAVPAGVAAWVISVIVLYVIAYFTTFPFEAIGIPAV